MTQGTILTVLLLLLLTKGILPDFYLATYHVRSNNCREQYHLAFKRSPGSGNNALTRFFLKYVSINSQ